MTAQLKNGIKKKNNKKNINKKTTYGLIAVILIIGVMLSAILLNNLLYGDPLRSPHSPRALTQDDLAMIEHCRMMPQMTGCEEYLELGQKTEVTQHLEENKYDRSVSDLELAQKSQIAVATSSQSLLLEANIVKKEISGRTIRMYGYNSQIPGPLIKVKQGEKLSVDFKNNLDVETTVHWHGLRLDNAYDGVPGVTQEPVQPGDSFHYELSFPDSGLYWYHPHVREDYQQELGLYGMIYVEPVESDSFNEVTSEEVLVIDDILLRDGEVPAFDKNYANLALMGRFGNTMLINGETNYAHTVAKGSVVRYFLANVANTRTFNIEIPGAKMKLVGSDGGLYAEEEFVDSVIIAPSERYIVEVLFENEGTYQIRNTNPLRSYVLGTVVVSDRLPENDLSQQFMTLKTYPKTRADIERYREFFSKEPDVNLKLSINMAGMHGNMMQGMMGDHEEDEGIEWEDTMAMMNQQMTSDFLVWEIIDEKTGKKNIDIDYRWNVGDLVKISIFNDPNSMHPMQHPIHFHGNRFLVLAQDDVPNENLVWKDTVLVPVGKTIDVLLEISNPGEWMAHCHIAEHLTSGMMTSFEVQ